MTSPPTSCPLRAIAARVGALAAAIAAIGCAAPAPDPARRAPSALDTSHNAYGHALPGLTAEHWADVRAGKAVFVTTWVARGEVDAARATRGPAAQLREGLGPRYNADSCEACHFRDGRGGPYGDGLPRAASAPPRDRDADARARRPRLVRLALRGADGAPAPVPGLGVQIQDRALAPDRPEAALALTARAWPGRYPDGTPFALEAPVVALARVGDGRALGDDGGAPLDLPAGTRRSLRGPPSLVGLGLLEAVPADAIAALADPADADGDGVSGRPNYVRDPETAARVLGRFGWKAGQPSLRAQNATALREDLGVTTPVFPPPCAIADEACPAAPPELDAAGLEQLTRYTRLLAPPPRRGAGDPVVARGELLFTGVGCASCHHPRLPTGPVADLPELAGRVIEPYTDLLLHDLGPGLADELTEGEATGAEWRTAPLWGLGRLAAVTGEVRLLHDGRARSAEEAILWHAGEAQIARDRFAALPREGRAALLAFLASL